jgi:Domain of unknown function (DUF4252)
MEGIMLRYCYLSRRHFAADALAATALVLSLSAAYSHAAEEVVKAPAGRLDFAAANLPEANVEVDLSQDMFQDIFGIGDAALAGVAESLLKGSGDDKGDAPKLAAHQLEAAREIMQLASNVVREVHVRLYEGLPEGVDGPNALYKPFEEQLSAGNWETIARVRDDENLVRVAVIRNEGSVKGVFVIATDGESVALANVVCDVSPDNVKKLTSAATTIGLENGLAAQLQLKFQPQVIIGEGHSATITLPASDGPRATITIPAVEAPRAKIAAPPTPPAPPVPAEK